MWKCNLKKKKQTQSQICVGHGMACELTRYEFSFKFPISSRSITHLNLLRAHVGQAAILKKRSHILEALYLSYS